MKTVLITGAYGQLGEACTNYLKLNFNVISSGRQAEGRGVKLDITDCNSIEHVQNEFHPDARHDRAGILSMANSGVRGGKATNGSQFFITYKDTSFLLRLHKIHILLPENTYFYS